MVLNSFEPIDNKIKTFHLNTIKNVEVLHNKYSFDKTKIDSFKNAINAYHKLDSEKNISNTVCK